MNKAIYLKETKFLDYSHPLFTEFLTGIEGKGSEFDQILALYSKVRDGFLYSPYHLDIRSESLRASKVLTKSRAWCVEKSNVMAACSRRLGVPSRLVYAIVQNHIGVEKLAHYLKRPEIVFHGYVQLFLNEKWVSCTPAFDKRICKLSGVPALDFDGENDSIFQAFSGENRFMEYLHEYGHFSDVPIDLMHAEMKKYYPHLFETPIVEKDFSFRF